MDYKKAGVDIEAGYKSVELMKEHVKRTMREEVLGGLGGFSGAFSLKKIKEMEDPVLQSGTDGSGTKVKLTVVMDQVKDVLTVPVDAVNYDNGKAFVYCYDNGAAKKVMIEAGIYDAQTMEVKSGLTAGDQVITTWSNELVD